MAWSVGSCHPDSPGARRRGVRKVGHLAQDPPPLTTALLLFPLGYSGSNFMSDSGLFKEKKKKTYKPLQK